MSFTESTSSNRAVQALEWLADRTWLVPLAVALGPLILVGRELVRGRALFWGTPSTQFVPWWLEAIRQLEAGQLPLWNALNGMGAPLLANYQTSFFYPPNWSIFLFHAIGGVAGIAWGFTLLGMLHLVWGGWGMAALVRRLGGSRLAQALAGLAYALAGYWIGRLEFLSMIWVGAWIPWVLRYTDELASPFRLNAAKEKERWLCLPLVGSLTMMLLAGHAQLSWYTLELAGVWLLLGALLGDGWRGLLRALPRFAVAGIAAALVAAVQLLPTAEYLLQSQRAAAYGYQQALTYSFWPWRLVSLFAPDFFGNPGNGNFWGYGSYWEDHAYVGMLVILMALGTLGRVFREPRRGPVGWLNRAGTIFLWAVILITLMLALGSFTPVYPFLYHHVPSFAMFQAPARYLVWLTVALILLAAGAIDRWRYPYGRGLDWLRRGMVAAFAVTLGAGIGWLVLRDVEATFIRATALAGMWALGVCVLALWVRNRERPVWRYVWPGLVYAWLLADLLAAGWKLNPTVTLDFYSDRTGPQIAQTEEINADFNGKRIFLPEKDEYPLKFDRFFRFDDFTALEDWQGIRQFLLPNTNLYFGIPSVNNFDPMVPGRYAAWMDVLNRLPEERRLPLLQMMNVGLVELVDRSSPSGVRFEPVEGGYSAAIYSCSVQLPEGMDALVWMAQQEYSSTQLLLESDRPLGLPDCDGQSPQPVSLQEQADRLRIDLPQAASGWLFISQVWYPGWQAMVDGKAAEVYRANGAFMAVQIPAGATQVSLEYHPASFRIGALLSILMLVFLSIFRIVRPGEKRRTPV